ncbi:hypothetical protein KKF34_08430 [Myxococcota bacterium]|nr:hypothetical protein [Myxococcota bacterium]MBU1379678.1 hypothetical protein [Myxococcota bacterium]MBU1496889.1 hypothetical protein [Myxococcota bacterium]
MKKHLILLTLTCASLISCKTSTGDDSPRLPASKRGESIRPEIEPVNVISFKRAGGNNEMVDFVVSNLLAMKDIKLGKCGSFLSGIESAVFISTGLEFEADKVQDDGYLGVTGIKAIDFINCLAKDGSLSSSGSIGGFSIWRDKSKDKSLIISSTDRLAVISKNLEMKVAPGKGMLGKIQFEKFLSDHNVSITLKNLKHQTITQVTGYADFKNKLTAVIELGFKSKTEVDKVVKQWADFIKNSKLVPIPGLKEIVESVSLTHSGESIVFKSELALKDMKNIISIMASLGSK